MTEPRTANLEGVIRASFVHLLSQYWFCLPGQIESLNTGDRRANVKPMVQRRYSGVDKPVDLPVVVGVPLVEMRCGRAFLSLPLAKGDPVLMVFSDRALDNWIGSAGAAPVDPLDVRMHDLTDAFAIPGGWPILKSGNRPGANPDALDLQVEPGTKFLIGNGAVELFDQLDQIIAQLEDISTGLIATLITHTHTSSGAGPPQAADITAMTLNQTTLTTIKALLEQLKK